MGFRGCFSATMTPCDPKAGLGSWSKNQPRLLEAMFRGLENAVILLHQLTHREGEH